MLLVAIYLGFAVLAGLAPVILRQWALRRAEQDPVSAWFGYAIRLNWIGLAAVLLMPVPFLYGSQYMEMFRGMVPDPIGSMLRFMFCLLPAAAMRVSATLVSHDLSKRLRGVDIERRVTTEMAILNGASLLLTLPLVVGGGVAFVTWGFEVGLLFILTGTTIGVAALVRSQKLQGFTLHAVTSGELRDRVFALAAKANVRLDQVFALPFAKWKFANAFATQGRRVMVTDYLLEHLDRDEVDAVMAHEIAHVAGKDPERQALFTAILIATGAVAAASFGLHGVYTFGWILFVSLITLGYSRRCEYGADARAITLGVRPQASITGLAKLNRLGLVPIDYPMFVELWMTHPSTRRRAHAVGKKANLSAAEVDQLLEPGAASQAPKLELTANTERYVAPALEPGAKLFSTTFKQVTVFRISILTMLAGIATAMAMVNAAGFLGIWGWSRFALWPIAMLLVAATMLVLIDWLACYRYRTVANSVADRLAKELPTGLNDWIGVGLAPHGEPRVYEGFSVWDVGLISLHGRLDYRGEETRFSLTRDEVTEVSLRPGPPGWIQTQGVVIFWRKADGTSGQFALGPTITRLSAAKAEAWKLYTRIRQWRSPNPGSVTEAPIGPPLGTPPTGEVTATLPGADLTARALLNLAILYLFLTSLFGSLVRMPAGIGPVAGIFDAILVVFLGHLLLLVPIIRGKGASATAAERRKAA